MKTLSGIMSEQSKEQYLESCRARYPSRNRAGKSAMIDEVGDVFGWERKHTIKALNGQDSVSPLQHYESPPSDQEKRPR
jgi:hypothetical protein